MLHQKWFTFFIFLSINLFTSKFQKKKLIFLKNKEIISFEKASSGKVILYLILYMINGFVFNLDSLHPIFEQVDQSKVTIFNYRAL